jgi:hypothetical protein
MEELAATTPSSPLGVIVLVDILFLVPFSVFSCAGSVSVLNISLYSKLSGLSNRPNYDGAGFSRRKKQTKTPAVPAPPRLSFRLKKCL